MLKFVIYEEIKSLDNITANVYDILNARRDGTASRTFRAGISFLPKTIRNTLVYDNTRIV